MYLMKTPVNGWAITETDLDKMHDRFTGRNGFLGERGKIYPQRESGGGFPRFISYSRGSKVIRTLLKYCSYTLEGGGGSGLALTIAR
jgi:hypothetical protein